MILQVDNTWPAALPLPSINYSGNPRNGTIMSQDKGTLIARRSRFERSYSGLAVTWVLTSIQFASFKTFLHTNLNNGASQCKIELRFPYNTELTEWAMRIEDGYSATRADGIWTVTANLDLVNPIIF